MGRQGPGAAAFPGAGRWRPPRGSRPLEALAWQGGTRSARSWTGAVAGPPCPLRSTAWGRRAPGLPLLFLPRWARPSPRKPPTALPTLEGRRRPQCLGARPTVDAQDGRAPPSAPARGAPRAHRAQLGPLAADGTCGESGLESRSGTMIGSARAASLALGFLTLVVGHGLPWARGTRRRLGVRRLEARPGGCEAGAGTALAATPERGSPTPGTVGKTAWCPPPHLVLLQRRLRALALLGSLLSALSSKQFQRFLFLCCCC